MNYNTDTEDHVPQCDDQPNGKDCICLEVKEAYIDEQANNGESEFEGR